MEEWLRIGEVARRTGLTHRTLRHYDEIGLLRPSGRTDVDYRLYAREDLDRLLAIQHLKALGLSLGEISEALDEGGDAAELLGRHAAVVEARIAQEQELLSTLRRLQRAANAGWDEVLRAIELRAQSSEFDDQSTLYDYQVAKVHLRHEQVRVPIRLEERRATLPRLIHYVVIRVDDLSTRRDRAFDQLRECLRV